MTTVGRPKQYRNDAEKQRAYRKRQKAEKQQMKDALAMLKVVKSKAVTLRYHVDSLHKRGKTVLIDTNPRVQVHRLMADRFVHKVIEDTTFQYLLMVGAIAFIEHKHSSDFYEFTEKLDNIKE